MEECPVCYCSPPTCNLYCGHSFCKSCVKEWYMKSEEPTCPMCREELYFKGLDKYSKEWEDERTDTFFQSIFEEHIESILEEEIWFGSLIFISEVQERLKEIREIYEEYDLSRDEIEDMIWDYDEILYYKDEIKMPKMIHYFSWQAQIKKGISKHQIQRRKTIKNGSPRGIRDCPEQIMYIII